MLSSLLRHRYFIVLVIIGHVVKLDANRSKSCLLDHLNTETGIIDTFWRLKKVGISYTQLFVAKKVNFVGCDHT